jgi:hypothetical protein
MKPIVRQARSWARRLFTFEDLLVRLVRLGHGDGGGGGPFGRLFEVSSVSFGAGVEVLVLWSY